MKPPLHPAASWAKSSKARWPYPNKPNQVPLINPFLAQDELEKKDKEISKLKEKVRRLEGEIFDLVVLEDHVPKPKEKKK